MLLFCNTFHFYQPAGATNLCLDDDVGYPWIEGAHQMLYGMIVGDVTQIDDEILDVVHRRSSVLEQGSDVFQESACLSGDVAFV